LQQVYAYNRTTGITTPMPRGPQPTGYETDSGTTSVSGDGKYVSYGVPDAASVPGLPPDFNYITTHRYNLQTGEDVAFEVGADNGVVLSNDGSHALYYLVTLSQPNGQFVTQWDAYLKNIQTGVRQLVAANVSDGGGVFGLGSLSMSDDYSRVSYQDLATGEHVADFLTGENIPIEPLVLGTALLTADGQQIVFDGNPGIEGMGYQVYASRFVEPTPPDTTPPTISYTLSPTPNAAGWNKSDVTVAFACADADSGVASCSSPATVSTEGTNNQITGMATDNAGNTATATAIVKLDKTAPTVGTPTMTSTFILFSANETISAMAGDALSGVAGGEYYIDTDPGVGNATAMTYAAGKVIAVALPTPGSVSI